MEAKIIKQSRNLVGEPFSFDGNLSFSTDSRNINSANAFICLYGEKFDGFNFIETILEESLDVIFYEYKDGRKKILEALDLKGENIEFVAVKNIYDFLLEIGHLNSENFKNNSGKIIGLTGSNGKTTNKEMLAWLLNGVLPGKVLWTKGNLNNHIGVPLTLLRLGPEYEIAIIEMGTNHPGEVEVLAQTAGPTHAMITNIGHAHLEFLKDLNGVYKEKTELFKQVEKEHGGYILINQFDEYLKNYKTKSNSQFLSNENLKMMDEGFKLTVNNRELIIKNPSLYGNHQKINMAQCLTMAINILPEQIDSLAQLANSFRMPAMNRGEIIKTDTSEIFLDAYNANPDSMRASLTSFSEMLKSRSVNLSNSIFILGDMNELGSSASIEHLEIGKFLKNLGAIKVGFVGRYARDYCSGFGSAEVFSTSTEAKEWFSQNNASFVFIKGSRSLQLESILDIKVV